MTTQTKEIARTLSGCVAQILPCLKQEIIFSNAKEKLIIFFSRLSIFRKKNFLNFSMKFYEAAFTKTEYF